MFYSVFIVHDQMSCYHAALFFFEINSALSVSQMYATPASLISVQVILAEIVAPLCACCKDISCIMTLLQFMLVVFQHLEDTCIDPQSCRKSPQLPSLSSGTESVFKPSFRLDVSRSCFLVWPKPLCQCRHQDGEKQICLFHLLVLPDEKRGANFSRYPFILFVVFLASIQLMNNCTACFRCSSQGLANSSTVK